MGASQPRLRTTVSSQRGRVLSGACATLLTARASPQDHDALCLLSTAFCSCCAGLHNPWHACHPDCGSGDW